MLHQAIWVCSPQGSADKAYESPGPGESVWPQCMHMEACQQVVCPKVINEKFKGMHIVLILMHT